MRKGRIKTECQCLSVQAGPPDSPHIQCSKCAPASGIVRIQFAAPSSDIEKFHDDSVGIPFNALDSRLACQLLAIELGTEIQNCATLAIDSHEPQRAISRYLHRALKKADRLCSGARPANWLVFGNYT
jgi:hypothetical protein